MSRSDSFLTFQIMQTDVSSNAKRPRQSWSLRVAKINNTSQIDIIYKDSRGKEEPFSKSHKGAKIKIPWGPPSECELVLRKDGMNLVKELKFRNKKCEFTKFDINLFNSMSHINSFSQKIIALINKQQFRLLSYFLTLAQRSKGFIHNNEEEFDDNGFATDKSKPQIEDLVKEGGSNSSYYEFLSAAQDSAMDFDKIPKVARKRINLDSTNSTPEVKVSRKDIINDKEKSELTDPNGLEAKYRKSFVGVAHIPISNLSVHKDLSHLIMKTKVDLIEQSLLDRYDPSLLIPVVCPEDPSAPFSMASIETQRFLVVQKVQSFTALKNLQAKGQLDKLIGHSQGEVMCYVINPGSVFDDRVYYTFCLW